MAETNLGEIVDIENVWIVMFDGCRIAARIWLPKGAEAAPVPAILEHIPYRKRDFMQARAERIHRYFAQRGYAAVRVDLGGSGGADGILFDEYSQQELDDALEIKVDHAEEAEDGPQPTGCERVNRPQRQTNVIACAARRTRPGHAHRASRPMG